MICCLCICANSQINQKLWKFTQNQLHIGSGTYRRCPRKYCHQSRHGKGHHLPEGLALPSDVLHPHTQRTSCDRERSDGSEKGC